jgi:hypothetical protein
MFAESAAQSARQSSQVAEDLSIGAAGAHGDRQLRGPDGLLAEVDRMASEYNQIRQNEQRSAPRTSKMTTIASNMIASLNGVGQDVFDVTAHLDDHSNDGRRLAAYAYLYANPDPRLAQHLTDAVLIDSTSFGQYWGIRALRRLIATDPAAIDLNTRRRLEQFLAGLGPSTDRAFELRELLREAETGPRA